MRAFWLSALLSCALVAAARGADVLVVGDAKYEGLFLGLEDGNFLFRTKDGQSLSEPQAKVTSITLEKPRQAALTRGDRSQSEEAEVLRYSKPQLFFQQNGRKDSLFASRIKALTIEGLPDEPGAAGGAAQEVEDVSIDLAALESQPALSEAQKDALARYKAAKEQFDAFIRENGALVQAMNAADGGKRQELLTALRLRKNQEQPLRRELNKALNALRAAFPEALPENGAASAPPRDVER
jgi:hypothetical protein